MVRELTIVTQTIRVVILCVNRGTIKFDLVKELPATKYTYIQIY